MQLSTTDITAPLEIWVEPSEQNYSNIIQAFSDFRMPLFDMTSENFLNNAEFDVFSFGVSPVRIDLMTQAKGLVFESCYNNAEIVHLENYPCRIVSYQDLIKAKKASARPKDIDDIEHLKGKEK